MPSVQAAIYIEYSLIAGTQQAALFTGTTVGACITACKAVVNFKHIDTYLIITYNGSTVINPQPIINQGTI